MTTPDPRRWWALWLIAAAQFMVIMDTSIIGVALPEMQRALGFSQEDLSWVFNAYVIAFGGLLLLGGRLGDLFGPRRVFTAGWVVLTGASLVAGLAQDVPTELAARAAQGVGAALIAPAALTLLMRLFSHDGRELGRAFALYAAAAPAGGTAGVFLGGVLTEWVDWRWVFLVNVPVGLVALLLIRAALPVDGPRTRGRLDLAGAALVTGALSLIVFGLVRAEGAGWGSAETLGVLAAGLILLVLFLALQRVRREPLVALSIFRAPGLAVGNLAMALLGAAWIPLWFFLNLQLQQVQGYGAFAAGAALLPMTVVIMILMVAVTERLVRRLGPWPVAASGLVLLAVGAAMLTGISVDGGFWTRVLPGSLVAATGMALAFIPVMMSSLAGARPDQAGLASGLVNTTYQVGSAVGLAAMTAIAAAATGAPGDPAALTDGFRAAFAGAAAVAAAAAVLAGSVALRSRATRRAGMPPSAEAA